MFYQPAAVYIDPSMAKSLPRRYLHNGLGEAVKLGCVADKDLFELFEKAGSDMDILRVLPEIIQRCVAIKAHYVEIDPGAKVNAASLTSAIPSEALSNAATAMTMPRSPTAKPQPSA